jgi:hypothetical protein
VDSSHEILLNERFDNTSKGWHLDKGTGCRPLTDSFTLGGDMGSEESEQMMALLQELSMLKEADAAFEANPTDSEREAYQLRQQRRHEIGAEMKALAEQKKKAEQSVSKRDPAQLV